MGIPLERDEVKYGKENPIPLAAEMGLRLVPEGTLDSLCYFNFSNSAFAFSRTTAYE